MVVWKGYALSEIGLGHCFRRGDNLLHGTYASACDRPGKDEKDENDCGKRNQHYILQILQNNHGALHGNGYYQVGFCDAHTIHEGHLNLPHQRFTHKAVEETHPGKGWIESQGVS